MDPESTTDAGPESDVSTEAPVTPEQPDTSVETTEAPEPTTQTTEDAPAEGSEESSPEESGFTEVDPESLSDELRERYQQMQADYTQKTQAIAEQRRELEGTVAFVEALVADDPDDQQAETREAVFRALGAQLGYSIEDGDGVEVDAADADGTDDEPVNPLEARLAALEAKDQAEAQAQADADYEQTLDAAEAEIESGLKALAKADGIDELTEEELDLLFDNVLSRPPVGDKPDVEGAYKRLRSVLNVNKERWVQTKQADPAPDGVQGTDKPDLSTPEKRIAHAARSVQAARRD